MSRVEENKEWVDRQPRTFTGSMEDIDAKIKMCVYGTLLDISRSLAMIADGHSSEADAYVRDKLLIDWFISKWNPEWDREETYKHWMIDMGGKMDGQ